MGRGRATAQSRSVFKFSTFSQVTADATLGQNVAADVYAKGDAVFQQLNEVTRSSQDAAASTAKSALGGAARAVDKASDRVQK